MSKVKRSTFSYFLGFICTLFASPSFAAEDKWFPFPVEVWAPAFNTHNQRSIEAYRPIEKASKKWNICVSFPHMKDSYWLAVNYGVASEAKRLGIRMRLLHAGGYNNLNLQIKQLQKCVAKGADGVVIAGISYTGLNPLIKHLRQQGLPVVDLVNDISSTKISAKSLVSFKEMGFKAGEYIVKRHLKGDKPTRIAWFPGPKDAGWVKKGDEGFKQAINTSQIDIVDTIYGDTGKLAQSNLIDRLLDRHPDLDYIAGTAVTAEAAVKILKERGLEDKIKIVAYYFTPGVYRHIKLGNILAAPTDSPVIQGRIAMDQVTRLLENKDLHRHVGPALLVVNKDNINSFNQTTSLAPNNFSATFLVDERTKNQK